MFEKIASLFTSKSADTAALESEDHAVRADALLTRRNTRAADQRALFGDLERQRAERIEADRRADEDDVARLEARRHALASTLAASWFARVAPLLARFADNCETKIATEVATAYRDLQARTLRELGTEPSPWMLSAAVCELHATTCPSIVAADLDRQSVESDPAIHATRCLRAIDQPLAFAGRLRDLFASIEAMTATPPTADEFSAARFALAKTCVAESARRRVLELYEREIVEKHAREANARSHARRAALAPFGTRMIDGRVHALDANGRPTPSPIVDWH